VVGITAIQIVRSVLGQLNQHHNYFNMVVIHILRDPARITMQMEQLEMLIIFLNNLQPSLVIPITFHFGYTTTAVVQTVMLIYYLAFKTNYNETFFLCKKATIVFLVFLYSY
jgi:hypothetical protein